MSARFALQNCTQRVLRQIATRFAQLRRRLQPPALLPPPLPPLPNAPRTMMPPPAPPRRISHLALLVATLVLLAVAEFGIPGGLTPRRLKEQILAKRVAEQLDIVSPSDPNLILPGGPLPIDLVHRRAIVHRGAWMFALDSHLRLLLAWRAPSMMTCPMTWSPIGEHSITNETFEETARRGVQEEARFIARPRIFPIGEPFFYHHIYDNGTANQRVDNQWTQAYIVLPRGDALDFRTLDDQEAQGSAIGAENSRYQGMALPDVVRHAMEKPDYFCHSVHVKWMMHIIPLVIRVLKRRDKRLYKGYLRDDWEAMVQSGAPVCCEMSERDKLAEEVNVTACGVPCNKDSTDLLSDSER